MIADPTASFEPLLRQASIDGTVAVEARGHLEETEQLLAIAERTPCWPANP